MKGTGFAIVLLAGANLFVLLCVCLLLTSHLAPRNGFKMKAAHSHFVIGSYDRAQSHIITVLPGDSPRVFMEDHEVSGGLEGVDAELDAWKTATPSTVTIILVCDEAVSVGTMQQLADKVLSHGFTCALFGRPASDE